MEFLLNGTKDKLPTPYELMFLESLGVFGLSFTLLQVTQLGLIRPQHVSSIPLTPWLSLH